MLNPEGWSNGCYATGDVLLACLSLRPELKLFRSEFEGDGIEASACIADVALAS